MEDNSWSEALYGPLPLSGESLMSRFLCIHRGTDNDQLKCTLFTSTLIGARYEALSYTWGTDAQTNPVTINGIVAGVTANLRDAILALRRPNKSRVMWIDAVCINQSDTRERGHQVQQMGDIYQCAARVIVWLGPESDDSAELFKLMRLHPHSIVNGSKSKNAQWIEPSLTRLLERRYWRRVWIVQEVARAKSDPILLCGKEELVWTTLIQYLSTGCNPLGKTHIQLLQTIRERVKTPPRLRLYGDEVPTPSQIEASYMEDLLFFLGKTDAFDATDPRDKVFALFGMARGSSQVATADYGRSVARVFIDLAKTAISRTNSLNVTRYKSPSRLAAELPTWVPDFASKRSRAGFMTNVSRAGFIPNVTPRVLKYLSEQQRDDIEPIFSENSSVLRVSGKLISTISGLEMPINCFRVSGGLVSNKQAEYERHVRRFLYWQYTSQTGQQHADLPVLATASDEWAVALYSFGIQLHKSNDWKCHSSPETHPESEDFLRKDLLGALDVRAFLREVQDTITPEAWAPIFDAGSVSIRPESGLRTDVDVAFDLIAMAARASGVYTSRTSYTYGKATAILFLISAALQQSTSIHASFLHGYRDLDPEASTMGAMRRIRHLDSGPAMRAALLFIGILQSHPALPPGPCPLPPGTTAMAEALGRISHCGKSAHAIYKFKQVMTSHGSKGFVAGAIDVRPGDRIVFFNNTATLKLLREADDHQRFQLLGDVYLHPPDLATYIDQPIRQFAWQQYTLI